MYTLRTIYCAENQWQEQGTERNDLLGESYTYINAEKSGNSFRGILKENAWPDELQIYGIIRDEKGKHTPLYLFAAHFIVTDKGQTFARLN